MNLLRPLNIGDPNEAIDWTVDATTTPDDGDGQLFGGTGTSTIRGVCSKAQTRDFFVGGANPDTYKLDRIDYARGRTRCSSAPARSEAPRTPSSTRRCSTGI